MPAIQSSATITASTQTDDVLANNILAISRGLFLVEYALVASAAGILADILVGLNTVASQIAPSVQNRVPVYPDDFLGRFGVIPGDRIILRARETSGNNRTLYYTFRFTPVR